MTPGADDIQRQDDDPLVWVAGRSVTLDQLSRHALRLTEQLPRSGAVINLCENRYRFLVGFLAALRGNLTTVLPPSKAPGAIQAVAWDFTSALCLVDGAYEGPVPAVEVSAPNTEQHAEVVPALGPQSGDVAACLYTSGSTGHPTPNPKHWGLLRHGSQSLIEGLGLHDGILRHVVATVPPQHMYGFETTVLLPLFADVAVHSGRPFFPQDIAEALAALPEPRILVSTPVHLRACLDQGLKWPALERIVCSTSALAPALAERIQDAFACPLLEIYGSTETGAIACRETASNPLWSPLPGMKLRHAGDLVVLTGPQLDSPFSLSDRLHVLSNGKFEVLGRAIDVVKVGGKRASLADLNLKLNSVPGVEDGAMFVPDRDSTASERLMAVVVAPEVSDRQIREALANEIDPVFLPRLIIRTDALPRNETGKLPQEDLMDLVSTAIQDDS
jgi:acyl-coenzyme A synthetase/AMP-(fatty) acid ligase